MTSDERALSAFRMLLAAAILMQALATARDLPLFVGRYGLMQQPVNEAVSPVELPRLSWLAPIPERPLIYACLGVYLVSVFYAGAGFQSVWFATLALFIHLLFKGSGFASSYGAADLATNGLFFCIVLPGLTPGGARRVLRLYLTLVYAASGIEKLTGEAWRDGDAIWNFLMRPEVTIAKFGWLSAVPWLAVICGWSVLAIEIGYATTLFFERLRKPFFIATLLMHVAIAVAFHLWVFSLTMIALNCGALAAVPAPSATFRRTLSFATFMW